ncbi:hypothetical protein [Pseudomonas putida]|nr:hypothetical protein [Pseudomonas putida]
MSGQQVESMGVAEVVQELTRIEQHAAQARKVLVVTGSARPVLLAHLRKALVPIGIDCVEVEPLGQQEYFDGLPEAQRVSIQSFAELLASPELAPLMRDPIPEGVGADPVRVLNKEAEVWEQAPALPPVAYFADDPQLVADPLPEPEPAPVQEPPQPKVQKLDMGKPINWVLGDIFTENPKFSLPHQRREWFLKSMDVSDKATLQGVDIEIERVNAHQTELMTIEQFMRRYVFVRRAETPAE